MDDRFYGCHICPASFASRQGRHNHLRARHQWVRGRRASEAECSAIRQTINRDQRRWYHHRLEAQVRRRPPPKSPVHHRVRLGGERRDARIPRGTFHRPAPVSRQPSPGDQRKTVHSVRRVRIFGHDASSDSVLVPTVPTMAARKLLPDGVRDAVRASEAVDSALGAVSSAGSSPPSPFPLLSFSPLLSPDDLNVATQAVSAEIAADERRPLFKPPRAPKKPPMLSMQPVVSSSSTSESEGPPEGPPSIGEVLDKAILTADSWSVASVWKCMSNASWLSDADIWQVVVGDDVPSPEEARRFKTCTTALRLARRETFAGVVKSVSQYKSW